MRRTPTKKQYRLLLVLGSGAFLVAGRKREIDPLLRHGWVTTTDGYGFTQITPDGLLALAAAAEKFGLPKLKREAKV